MRKSKTNISVRDNTGVNVTPSIIVGDTNKGYTSGDILDANAVAEKVATAVSDYASQDTELSRQLESTIRGVIDKKMLELLDVKDTILELTTAIDFKGGDDTTVNGELKVEGDLILNGDVLGYEGRPLVFVDGLSSSSNVDIDGDISIVGDVNVGGYLCGSNQNTLDIATNCKIDGELYVNEEANFTGGIDVEGGATFHDDVEIYSELRIKNDCAVYARDFIKDNSSRLVTTIYIDETNSESGSKVEISGQVAATKINGNWVVESPETNVISWIRANSRIVCGAYDKDTKTLIIQNREDAGESTEGNDNTFMKLPRFWYRCTTVKPLKYKLEFTHDETAVDDSWNEWDGNTFIGCYKATFGGESDELSGWASGKQPLASTVLRSKAGSRPNTAFSWRDGRTMTRAMGDGFSLITYDAHKMMEILFYAYYGEVDSQLVCGAGAEVNDWNWNGKYYPINGRYQEFVSEVDTKGNDDPINNNFWGLCDWWGNVYEWVDDLQTTGYNDDYSETTLNILNYDGTVKRQIRGLRTLGDAQTQKLWGKYADVISTAVDSTEDDYYDTGYTVYGYVYGNSGCVADRSDGSDYSDGGVGCLYVGDDPGRRVGDCGSRLLYRGAWADIDELSSEYKQYKWDKMEGFYYIKGTFEDLENPLVYINVDHELSVAFSSGEYVSVYDFTEKELIDPADYDSDEVVTAICTHLNKVFGDNYFTENGSIEFKSTDKITGFISL